MPTCDEDDCDLTAIAVCPGCAVMLCEDHCGGDGSECPDCSTALDGLG